jgi:serine/threonine protein kinase
MLADVFSLGVMLFLLTSKPLAYPFDTSKLSDSKYKFIAKQRKDVFWKYHCKKSTDFAFSDELMDIITAMFQEDPLDRPSLNEL